MTSRAAPSTVACTHRSPSTPESQIPTTSIVWFRFDLRLADNPALTRALDDEDLVVPVFIWAPHEEGDWPPGGAHRWWLHHSLASLDADLREKGSRLLLRRGDSLEVLRDLIGDTGANAVYWNTRHEPALRQRDRTVADALGDDGIACRMSASRILHDPEAVRTTGGGAYHVYTPFWRKLTRELDVAEPLPAPRMGATRGPSVWPESDALDDLRLTPEAQDGVDWAEGFRETWAPGVGEPPGEAGAHRRLRRFVEGPLLDYPDHRDRPDLDGVSMLSPRLHHGELSPRQVWWTVQEWVQNGAMRSAADTYLQEIAWREFSYHLLHHHPETTDDPLREKFRAFDWRRAPEQLERWRAGRTGYPIVDAGMRQLWATGWMHNRVRMIVASFLTKDLMIPWQDGAAWFWDCLVDGDLANNTMGWQWSAGCGADAQPFFRIFNPVTQGQRFDPDGAYVRRWVPELRDVPDRYVHHPWDAPHDLLTDARPDGRDRYPDPMVDHGEARDRALEAYERVK